MGLILIATVILVVVLAPWIMGSFFWFGGHKH